MKNVKIKINSAAPVRCNKISLVSGFNSLPESDWLAIRKASIDEAGNDAVEWLIKAGILEYLGKDTTPQTLNDLGYEEALNAIHNCFDGKVLKHWYLSVQPERWRIRNAISLHVSENHKHVSEGFSFPDQWIGDPGRDFSSDLHHFAHEIGGY